MKELFQIDVCPTFVPSPPSLQFCAGVVLAAAS